MCGQNKSYGGNIAKWMSIGMQSYKPRKIMFSQWRQLARDDAWRLIIIRDRSAKESKGTQEYEYCE